MKKFLKKSTVAFLLAVVFASGIAFAVPDVKFSTYGKVTIGYYNGDMGSISTPSSTAYLPPYNYYQYCLNAFEVTPAVGFNLPIGGDVVWGRQRFAVEVQVPVAFGKSYAGFPSVQDYPGYHWNGQGWDYFDSSVGHNMTAIFHSGGTSVVINPGAIFIWNYYLPKTVPAALQKLSVQLGLGMSTSVSIVSGTYYVHDRDMNTWTYRPFNDVGVGLRMNILSGVRYDFTDHFSALAEWVVGFIGGSSNSARIGVVWRF